MNSLRNAEGTTEVDLLRSLLQEEGFSRSSSLLWIRRQESSTVTRYFRGKSPLESPPVFFSVARENNLLWETERACRKNALATIRDAAGGSPLRFFIT